MAQRDLQTCIYGVGPQDLQADIYGVGPKDLQADIQGFDLLDLQASIFSYSLLAENFSLEVGQYLSASSSVCVDIIDYYNKINIASGTYFIVKDTVVSGTFTPITVSGVAASGSAYRMCGNPINDFSSLTGKPTDFVVRIFSDIGGVLEKNYHLTYGYKVEFDNEDRKYIDFGYQKKVIVRAVAENLASCTKESGYAYWFETKTQPHNDLSCSIRGTYIDDLPASIYPQSTTYFYGKTYRLVVSAMDYSGNRMEDFVLEYTIEDKPK